MDMTVYIQFYTHFIQQTLFHANIDSAFWTLSYTLKYTLKHVYCYTTSLSDSTPLSNNSKYTNVYYLVCFLAHLPVSLQDIFLVYSLTYVWECFPLHFQLYSEVYFLPVWQYTFKQAYKKLKITHLSISECSFGGWF
jgi:hypothetical protein